MNLPISSESKAKFWSKVDKSGGIGLVVIILIVLLLAGRL